MVPAGNSEYNHKDGPGDVTSVIRGLTDGPVSLNPGDRLVKDPTSDSMSAAGLIRAMKASYCGACWRCVPGYMFMRVCSLCGNKRCPHANDHRNPCTESNDAGQPGSAYEHGSGEASARRLTALANRPGGAA
jgi:hypothetical protein